MEECGVYIDLYDVYFSTYRGKSNGSSAKCSPHNDKNECLRKINTFTLFKDADNQLFFLLEWFLSILGLILKTHLQVISCLSKDSLGSSDQVLFIHIDSISTCISSFYLKSCLTCSNVSFVYILLG